MKAEFGGNREDRFVGAGKVIAGGKRAAPEMTLYEKDAGGLLGGKKQNRSRII